MTSSNDATLRMDVNVTIDPDRTPEQAMVTVYVQPPDDGAIEGLVVGRGLKPDDDSARYIVAVLRDMADCIDAMLGERPSPPEAVPTTVFNPRPVSQQVHPASGMSSEEAASALRAQPSLLGKRRAVRAARDHEELMGKLSTLERRKEKNE